MKVNVSIAVIQMELLLQTVTVWIQTIPRQNDPELEEMPKAWAAPSSPYMKSLRALTLFSNEGLTGCLPASLDAAGPSEKGLFQAPSGQLTRSAKDAATGTKISGFCR